MRRCVVTRPVCGTNQALEGTYVPKPPPGWRIDSEPSCRNPNTNALHSFGHAKSRKPRGVEARCGSVGARTRRLQGTGVYAFSLRAQRESQLREMPTLIT